ncbi:FAS1-like dehydratase domain-containing protein [Erythrobacter sp. Alg231-14]|uniref:FAS1-like dehydratase domain-containing protein n=1 Tax=Erythrobacter sp. Alg231-14 TaxID=1922225 RepID=UPI000D55ED66
MTDFSAWIGREVRASDRLDESFAQRWLSTFDLATPDQAIMPQGVHFALCTPDAATGALGDDGHPARDTSDDSFLPPFPMPRRMWASSTIEFCAPIAIGSQIERTSTVASIKEKEGSTGTLAFVNVDHETIANGYLSVRETQTLVYRDAAEKDAPFSPPAPSDGRFDPAQWDATRTLRPSPALLFRYSALTFNTHRIHYDAPYARDVERYRGLVVHGPLTASALLQLTARELGGNRVRRFEFRGVSPAIADEELHLAMRATDGGYELGAFASDGRQITKANASV